MSNPTNSFNKRLDDLEVEFLHGVPVKLPESAKQAIRSLILEEVIGENVTYQSATTSELGNPAFHRYQYENKLRKLQRSIVQEDKL